MMELFVYMSLSWECFLYIKYVRASIAHCPKLMRYPVNLKKPSKTRVKAQLGVQT